MRHDQSQQTSLHIYRIIYLDTLRIICNRSPLKGAIGTQKNDGWWNCKMDVYINICSIAIQANSFQDNMAVYPGADY